MKKVKIKDLNIVKTGHHKIITQDTLLEELVCDLSENHNLRGVFIVDAQGKLMGVMNRRNLLDWTRLQLGIRLREDQLLLAVMRKIVSATHVIDLCEPMSQDSSVTLEDSLADALDKMSQFNLLDIPVVDQEGQVIGDLSISEILSYVVKITP